jgi:hypothetical protein
MITDMFTTGYSSTTMVFPSSAGACSVLSLCLYYSSVRVLNVILLCSVCIFSPCFYRYPQEHLNEIHGSMYDPSNPEVQTGGTLRADLFAELLAWEDRADLSLCVGTSRGGGMSSDRVFRTVAKRGQQGTAIGGVIIGLQQTPEDHLAALKIYSKSDHVMEALLSQLHINLPLLTEDDGSVGTVQPYRWHLPTASVTSCDDVFRLPYDCRGIRILPAASPHTRYYPPPNSTCQGHGVPQISSSDPDPCCQTECTTTLLDLREGSAVVVLAGPYQGCSGEVTGKTPQGHYIIRLGAESASAGTGTCSRSTQDGGKDTRYRALSYIQSHCTTSSSIRSSSSSSSNSSNTNNASEDDDSSSSRSSTCRRGGVVECVLGLWWLESAARGGVASLPVANIIVSAPPPPL